MKYVLKIIKQGKRRQAKVNVSLTLTNKKGEKEKQNLIIYPRSAKYISRNLKKYVYTLLYRGNMH